MSHEIIYGKCFIKVDDKNFIPMVLIGSNNTYEISGRGNKRARDFTPLRSMLNNKLYGELSEMISECEYMKNQRIDDYNNPTDIEKNFGYYNSFEFYGKRTATYSEFINLFKNGCKNAKTIEELSDLGISVMVKNGYIPYDSKIETKPIEVRSTDELLKAIYELTEFYKNTDVLVTIYFGNHYDTVLMKIKKRINPSSKKQRAEIFNNVDHFFQIRMPNGGYLVRLTKYGYKYNFYTGGRSKKFLTEKEANNYIKNNEKISFGEVIRVNKQS